MQKYVIALYIRLSIEDYKYDSLSIENQSLVLHEYAASMPEALNAEIMEFIDNGYSGTNFERPQVQKLIELVRANQIDCIIVKDFSRFGRNSIETGYFMKTGIMKTSTRPGTNGRKGGKHPSSGVLLLYLFMISRNMTSSAALRMLFIAPTQVI